MQELIEPRATLFEGQDGIPLVLSCRLRLQLDRYIDDGGDDAVDERGKARQSNVDLALGFLSEITTGVVAAMSPRPGGRTKAARNAKRRLSGSGGYGKGSSEPTFEREFVATPAARLAAPRFERQPRDADTKFQGAKRRRRSFRERGGWSISCRDWRSASPATPDGRLFAQHRAGQSPLDAGSAAVAIGKSRE